MEYGKKFIFVVLTFCLICGSALAAEPMDIEEDFLIKVLRVLDCFDILYDMDSGGNFRPEEPVKRSEAVSDILKLANIQVNKDGSYYEESFSDITKSDECYDEVYTAAQYKIVVGDSGKFEPERNISCAELVKMLSVVMGYDTLSVMRGGYPNGYMTVAAEAGLLKSTASADGILTRRDYAVILYNALTAPLMTVSYNNGGTSISFDNEHTIMSDMHNTVTGRGVVTANAYTTLYTIGGVGANRVRINEELFTIGSTNAGDLIGQYVEYYAREIEAGTGEYELIGIWADESRLVRVVAADISEETDLEYFRVETDTGTIKKYRLEPNADVIYNGQAVVLENTDVITPDAGELILSDTDDNGRYDVIIVTAYTLQIVESVSPGTQRISYKDNKGSITLDDSFDSIELIKDKKPIGITELAQWDVLHIAMPPEPEKGILRILVSRTTAAGNLSRRDNDSVVIDNIEYDVAKEYNSVRLAQAKMGITVTAVLDIYGRVVDIQSAADSEFCGFLYKVSYDINMKTGYFVIFNESGEWLSLKSSEKMIFNGEKTDIGVIADSLSCTGDARGVPVDKNGYMVDIWGRYVNYKNNDPANGLETVTEGVIGQEPFKSITKRQMVVYTLDSDGNINSISTADSEDTEHAFIRKGSYISTRVQWRDGLQGFYLYQFTENNIYPLFYTDTYTKMFEIPFDYPNDKDKYVVRAADKTYFGQTDFTCYAETYGYKDDKTVNSVPYMLVQAGAKASYTEPMVVDKVIMTVDDEGVPVYLLRAYYKGKQTEFIVEDREALLKSNGEMLTFGDFVEFEQSNALSLKSCYNNYNNDIAFNVSKSFEEQKGTFGTFRGEYNLTRGFVTDINYEMRRLSIDNNDTVNNGEQPVIALNRDRETSYVYIVDMGAKTITVGDINSIETGDYAVASISWKIKGIALYRN